ncbi:MAG TPA: fumarylacetoacetate hydrolase family protein [Solirubrobacteraceae bacterium]|nr:fumarylacetoacetate hydrolase family protein [Solirubrobacteraceae bacterium]
MKAVRFVNPEGETRIGALGEDGTITDAGPAGPLGFVPTTLAWDALAQADGPTVGAGDVKLLHPVVPNKLIGIGLNYRSHAEESQLDIPTVPVIFAKFGSSLVGPGAEIVIPREETRPDYEGEVAVVIGQPVYRADEDEARAAVGGIAAINDVSGRRAQLETPLRQFTLGKSFDTFSPLGPCIASAAGIDLADIDLRTTVSGEVMQDANTRDLIFSVVELIQYISQGVTLEPGDVIATGTPSGVGDSRSPKRYLREGDTVEIDVEGVGTLSNPVRNER